MSKNTLILATTVALASAVALDSDLAHADKRVTVCHVPPGNEANAHTISEWFDIGMPRWREDSQLVRAVQNARVRVSRG